MIVLPRPRLPEDLASRPDRLPAGTAWIVALGAMLATGLAASPAALGLVTLVVLGLCLAARMPPARTVRALRLLALLLVMAWIPALILRAPGLAWQAAIASWRLVLFFLIARWLVHVAAPRSLARGLDRVAARIGLRTQLEPTVPLVLEAAFVLRDRLQGILFALALRGGPRSRRPWWWAAQLPRVVARLLMECELRRDAAKGTPGGAGRS